MLPGQHLPGASTSNKKVHSNIRQLGMSATGDNGRGNLEFTTAAVYLKSVSHPVPAQFMTAQPTATIAFRPTCEPGCQDSWHSEQNTK